jgi:hypothetical protein
MFRVPPMIEEMFTIPLEPRSVRQCRLGHEDARERSTANTLHQSSPVSFSTVVSIMISRVTDESVQPSVELNTLLTVRRHSSAQPTLPGGCSVSARCQTDQSRNGATVTLMPLLWRRPGKRCDRPECPV